MKFQKFDKILLDDPRLVERDACGVGLIAHIKGVKSHRVVSNAIEMLCRMDHRGGVSSDDRTSDGAGLLLQIPHPLFQKLAMQNGISLPEPGNYVVAQCFLPNEPDEIAFWISRIASSSAECGLKLLFNRNVPVRLEVTGPLASAKIPSFQQFVFETVRASEDTLERKFQTFLFRKNLEQIAREKYGALQKIFHIVSMSDESICYKALVRSKNLSSFYPDLTDPLFESAFALAHLRFSTNTQPSWALAQPFRTICHNGEINTLRGNINAMHARTPLLSGESWHAKLKELGPVCVPGLSDSAMLDNMVEFLLMSGRNVAHVMSMLVPEPWQHKHSMSQPLRDFYEYHSYLTEPWDGPALIGFCSGEHVGAVLDRNGLRPGRYCITNDDLVILASEAGVLPQPWNNIKESGRLTPGRIFLIDMQQGRIVPDDQIKSELSQQQSYGDWLDTHRLQLASLVKYSELSETLDHEILLGSTCEQTDSLTLTEKLQAFGYTREELKTLIAPMALTGKEAVGSMGADVPIAVLSKKQPLLFDYFRQGFAQVTNPPIDVIREINVTSLASYLGPAADLLKEGLNSAKVIRLNQPLLSTVEMQSLKSLQSKDFRVAEVSTCYSPSLHNINEALKELHKACLNQLQDGAAVLILSDRSISRSKIAIPSLLALSSVHHFLMRIGLRGQCSLISETGDARDSHHCALLIGYGASAVHPFVALEMIGQKNFLPELAHLSDRKHLSENFLSSLCDGILKIMSKMGITDINSYRGAQIFEALGINQTTIDKHFTWTQSRIGGIGLDELEADVKARHNLALNANSTWLPFGGKMQWNRDGEKHLHSPDMIAQLQNSVRINSRAEFRKYCDTLDSESKQGQNLRGLLKFRTSLQPVSLDSVEPASAIVKRFCTGAMSLGSISKETHESIALAMNRIGGKSNSGEGGEDPERFKADHNGENRSSQTKQIASGRFGVTLEYLQNATELQIKIAQGAKPGEGGQLPGHKVDPYIAQLRHSIPGVTLISPPPHHDIYSIEDLAQVIHDLKNANNNARINVKLVSSSGIGTIACGVAKAKAEAIMVSGAEGGTGASPISSILNAGLPWELGLSEVHNSLTQTGLRSRVVLQVDGQLRTPRDLAIAVLFGAQEWGIATGALISLGCIMMRKCHLNSCPVGIATQDPELRKKFEGQPEHLINYIFLMAEELRLIMAELGFKTINEMVGRADCLEIDETNVDEKFRSLDLNNLLSSSESKIKSTPIATQPQRHKIEEGLDERTLIPLVLKHLNQGDSHVLQVVINNTDRSVGTRLSSELYRLNQKTRIQPESISIHFYGSAGQSFMAFATQHLRIKLQGEANDYVCKGLSGALVSLVPPSELNINDSQNVICGNTALYGATSGRLYVRGLAGERFAVRNSGAVAVAEGIGDHGCEYMTGGTVIVLGQVGSNFGAGMSGGEAYIFDPYRNVAPQLNTEMVSLTEELSEAVLESIKKELNLYYIETQSPLAQCILRHWESQKRNFVSVLPQDSAPKHAQLANDETSSEIQCSVTANFQEKQLKEEQTHG